MLKRQVRTVSPGGTIHRDVLDVRGQTIASYAGTDDTGATYTDPTGGGAAGNDMLLMSEQVFDHGNDSGDGLLTSSIVHVDSNTIRTTSYIYDWRNRQIAIDGELELYQTSGYDNLNRVVQSERRDTTATGQLLSREAMLYDDRGRVYRSIRYGVDPVTGQITTQQDRDVTFDVAGNLLRQEPAGAMAFETYEYDLLGRRIEQTDPLGQSRQWTYDAAGNQIATTDPTNQVWTQSFDPLGRQVRKVNPLGEATRYRYDAAGRQSSVIDGVGNSSDSDYDAAGRIFASTDPLGKITTFTYDANGNQLSMTDPNGNTTTSEYDYLDRRIKVIDPVGHQVQMQHNLAGETIV